MKNNKLIAEFMGLPLAPCSIGTENGIVYEGYQHPKGSTPFTADGLQYKYSWDWLMPVVEKCLVGEAEQSEEISNTTIKNIYEGICNQDISHAYKSVVEFIKQHNVGKR